MVHAIPVSPLSGASRTHLHDNRRIEPLRRLLYPTDFYSIIYRGADRRRSGFCLFLFSIVDVASVADTSRHATNQRTPALRMMAVQRNALTINRYRRMGLDNLVDAVRSTIRVFFRTVDQIVQACNFPAVDAVSFRTSDNPSAM